MSIFHIKTLNGKIEKLYLNQKCMEGGYWMAVGFIYVQVSRKVEDIGNVISKM